MGDYPRNDVPAAIQLYIDIIDTLIRDIRDAPPAPQWNWFAENGPALVQELQALRGRLVQGPDALVPGDYAMGLMLRWYNRTLRDLSNDIQEYR